MKIQNMLLGLIDALHEMQAKWGKAKACALQSARKYCVPTAIALLLAIITLLLCMAGILR